MAIQAVDRPPIPRQPEEPILRCTIDASTMVKDIGRMGIIYSIVAKIFALHSFTGGFCFGVSLELMSGVVKAIYTIAGIDVNNRIAKIAKSILTLCACPVLAAALTTTIGFPITFSTAVVLHLATIGAIIGTTVCIGLALTAVVASIAGIAIIRRMCRDRCNAREAIERIRNDAQANNTEANVIRALDRVGRIFNDIFRRRPQPPLPVPPQECG